MNKAWMQTRLFRTALLALAALMSAGAAAGIGSMGVTQWRAAHARREIAAVSKELARLRAAAAHKNKAEEKKAEKEEKDAEKDDKKDDKGGTPTVTPTPEPTPTPDVLLDLVKEKRLFGVEKRTVNVRGIMGDAALIGDKWFKVGDTTDDGVKIIEILSSVVKVELNGDILEARPFAPMPGTEGTDASKFRAPREGDGDRDKRGRGKSGSRGDRGDRGSRSRSDSGMDRSGGVVETPRPPRDEQQRQRREEEVKRDIEKRREKSSSGSGSGNGSRKDKSGDGKVRGDSGSGSRRDKSGDGKVRSSEGGSRSRSRSDGGSGGSGSGGSGGKKQRDVQP